MEKDYAQVLSRILNTYSPVGEADAGLIFESGSIEDVRKHDIVFREKRFNGFEYFQLEGVSHRYNTDNDAQPLTTCIYQDEIVITPHFARTTNSQSIFSLEALTDCTYLKVPAGTFREIRDRRPQIRAFGQAVVEKEFTRSLQVEALFRSFTAKDRLLYFRANYPMLENMIPHTVIASFLGITPVSFSRLRRELSGK